MSDPDSKDDQPTVVEYTDGSTATLPSVAEFQRMADEADAQYAEFMRTGFGQALLNFDLSQP